jgi:hypothetical protein
MLHWLAAIRYHDWRLALEVAGMLLVVVAALTGPPPKSSPSLPPPAA